MAVTAPTPPTPPAAPTAPQLTPVEGSTAQSAPPEFGTPTVTQPVQDAKTAAQAANAAAQQQAADARQAGKSLAADTQQAANAGRAAGSPAENQQQSGKSLPAAAAGDETQSESQQAQPIADAQTQASGVPYWGFLLVFAAALLLFLLRDFLQGKKEAPKQRLKLDFTQGRDKGKKPPKSHFEIRI